MSTKKAIGISEEGILLADLNEAGTAGEYAMLGYVYKDTATLETAEGETIACECEELEDPEDEIYIPGATTLKFSTSNLDPQACKQAFGGEITTTDGVTKWDAPKNFVPKEVAVKFTTKTGLKVEIPRAKIRTRINWAIKKDGYGLLEHSLTVLMPQGEVAKMSISSGSQGA